MWVLCPTKDIYQMICSNIEAQLEATYTLSCSTVQEYLVTVLNTFDAFIWSQVRWCSHIARAWQLTSDLWECFIQLLWYSAICTWWSPCLQGKWACALTASGSRRHRQFCLFHPWFSSRTTLKCGLQLWCGCRRILPSSQWFKHNNCSLVTVISPIACDLYFHWPVFSRFYPRPSGLFSYEVVSCHWSTKNLLYGVFSVQNAASVLAISGPCHRNLRFCCCLLHDFNFFVNRLVP